MGNAKRLNYLDFVKGFAILLVVLGHIYDISNPIKIWLYSFHMPLFFIISGILIRIEIPIIYIINRYMPFMLGKFPKKKNTQTITD